MNGNLTTLLTILPDDPTQDLMMIDGCESMGGDVTVMSSKLEEESDGGDVKFIYVYNRCLIQEEIQELYRQVEVLL